MMKRGGGPVARQSGGMRQSFGGMSSLDSERMEEQAVQGATQQKAVAQQSSNAGTKSQPKQNAKKPPRDVSSLTGELERLAQDVSQELQSFFDLNALLGINREDTPEEQAKKKQLHQRYQQLTKEEQNVAQKKYQQELQKKQEEEKIKQQKEQEQREQEASTLPSVGKVSKRGTALMGGSKKKKAAAQMTHDRQRIGKLSSAN